MKNQLPWIVLLLIPVVIFGAVVTSPDYKDCKRAIEEYKTEKSEAKDPSALPTQSDCFFNAMHESHGIITALATLLIGFFTATLWHATNRLTFLAENQEKFLQANERAYIVCGGLYGLQKQVLPVMGTNYTPHYPIAGDYGPPWRIRLQNHGKTPGFIVEIAWGECPDGAFPRDISVSKIIAEKMLHVTRVNVRELIAPTGQEALLYRHVELPERKVGVVFFGKISYTDIFRKPRHSTFAILHGVDHSDTIGSSYQEDWS